MKQLKSIFILVLLLLSGQSKAQEAVIEDVSFLVQYIKGDAEGTRYSVALSKSFTQSEHGRELLRRVHDYSELAMNHMARKNTVNGLEQAKKDIFAEILENYEKNLAANKQFLAEGNITKEEFEKRKAQNEERRAAAEKQMQELIKAAKGQSDDLLNDIPDTQIKNDTIDGKPVIMLYREVVPGNHPLNRWETWMQKEGKWLNVEEAENKPME